jgi:hypothetical protein
MSQVTCEDCDHGMSARPSRLQFVVTWLHSVCKSFKVWLGSSKAVDDVVCCTGELFLEVVPVALLVPTQLPKNKLLRARFISYLHRMVECLGSQLLPMLPQTLSALLHRDCDVWDMCSTLRVVYQLTVKFPTGISDLLKELLPSIVYKCADSTSIASSSFHLIRFLTCLDSTVSSGTSVLQHRFFQSFIQCLL